MNSERFELHGVVHLVSPTGVHARTLAELSAGIARAEPGCLFYHVLQPALRSPASDDRPADDFSAWVGGVVQDRETAEHLSFAAQRVPTGPAAVRDALHEALERARHSTRIAPDEGAFAFLTAQSVTTTLSAAEDADTLMEQLMRSDASVWFYHLIEQPWFAVPGPPIVTWLRTLGAHRYAEWLEDAALSGRSIMGIRQRVGERWRRLRLSRGLARSSVETEAQRAESARAAVTGLARRWTRRGASS